MEVSHLMQKKQQYSVFGSFRLRWQWGKCLGIVYCFFSTVSAFAVVPFVDSGKLLRSNKYEISAHAFFISREEETDFNIIAQFDEGFLNRKDVNIRYLVGGGESGFLGGSFLKWVPFPDYKYQPALGASTGIVYNLFDLNTHYVSLHLRPFISKEVETVVGKFIPYIAFLGSIKIKNFSEVQFPLRANFGIRGELFFIHFHKMEFNFEFSTSITEETPSYFSVGIVTHW